MTTGIANSPVPNRSRHKLRCLTKPEIKKAKEQYLHKGWTLKELQDYWGVSDYTFSVHLRLLRTRMRNRWDYQ